jgi:phenylalanyl-tRNA synthetase alpha chain
MHIQDYFNANKTSADSFAVFDAMAPIVTSKQCFDDLLIPKDHVSRSLSDTYYYNENKLLRTHTSAHQTALIGAGHQRFLAVGDCYRRDEIDSSHYPVFHQMEGVKLFDADTTEEEIMADLKLTLEGLARHLFGEQKQEWVDAYFPFTHPSVELEIFFNEDWLEVLGCGVVQPQVIANAVTDHTPFDAEHINAGKKGWAFGLGLERLAMVLFNIPDIRLFWTQDKRFTKQFSAQKAISEMQFKPFSKYPPVFKDVSFWVTEADFQENDLSEVVREVAGDIAEECKLVDKFTNKEGRTSLCYRVSFRSMERNLTDVEVNELYFQLRDQAANVPGIEELR